MRALFVFTTTVALLLCVVLISYNAWQRRDFATVVPTNWSVAVFDPHVELIVAACPSIKKLIVDQRTNSLQIVCEYRNSAAARQELSPYLLNPQLLKTAEILDLPLSEVLAMSQGE